MLSQTKGIVLKSRDYGETHKIITIFTKQYGILNAICRGANKPKSALSAVTQNFIEADFLIYVGRGLATVQQGQVTSSFRYIREDIMKTAYTAFITELSDKIIEEKNPQAFLYDQLLQTLHYINEHETYMIPIIMYELKLYQLAGISPVLQHCVRCMRQQPPYHFSIQEGGFLCPDCSAMEDYAVKIPHAFSKLLPIFMQVGLEQIGNISVKFENQMLLRQLLDAYYDQYGGYALKSRRFLQQMNNLQ